MKKKSIKGVKGVTALIMMSIMLAGCGANNSISENTEAKSTALVTEEQKENTAASTQVQEDVTATESSEEIQTSNLTDENPAVVEMKKVLDELEENDQLVSSDDNKAAVCAAASLMNWAVGTPLYDKQIEYVANQWLSEKTDKQKETFTDNFLIIYPVYEQLLGDDDATTLSEAGCDYAAYPWSDQPLDNVEILNNLLEK